MIFDLIKKDNHITQRKISKTIEVAVSIVSSYIAFSNKMHEKSTLSEAEKIIAERLLTQNK